MLSEGDGQVAFIGSDKCDELSAAGQLTDVSVIDSVPMDCRLALQCRSEAKGEFTARLDDGEPLTVATSYPRLLEVFAEQQGYNLTAQPYPGGIEAFPRSGRTDLGFDIVASGATQRDNGLTICAETVPMWLNVIDQARLQDVSPVDELRVSLRAVAAVYTERLRQAAQEPSDSDSYTVRLLRSQNKLTKKSGEEFAEFLQAVLRAKSDPEEIKNEAADMLYVTGLWLARNGLTIEQVIDCDIERNNPQKGAGYE